MVAKPEIATLVSQQRRVRGVISGMAPGACEIDSMYGTFPFDPRSVKLNKNHPNRKPSVGDPCEFRLGHTVPTPAVSIRVAVPKVRKAPPSLEVNNPAVVAVQRVFESRCGHVSPLVMKISDVGLQRALVVFHILTHAVDVVEMTRLLPTSVKQAVLGDFMKCIHHPSGIPLELTHAAEHRELFSSVDMLSAVFFSLSDMHRMVIHSSVQRRAELLVDHLTRPVVTLQDNTDYLKVVGGLVGEGAVKLIDVYLAGRFNPSKPKSTVGLFVEKVEAVRTFMEFDTETTCDGDVKTRGHRFPQSVWGYNLDLFGQLASTGSRRRAVEQVNTLLIDAFDHAAGAIDLLAMVVDQSEMFCLLAIPCLIALNHIATLFGNIDQFSPLLPVPCISPKHAGDIMGIEHPTQSTWYFTKALDDFEERVTQFCGTAPPELAASIMSARSSVRRLDTAITMHAQQGPKPETRSLTRALLAEQGAALGGKLLYSMIDSLGTVFHQPYAQHPVPADYHQGFAAQSQYDTASMISYEGSDLGAVSVRSERVHGAPAGSNSGGDWRGGGGGALDYLTNVARSWLGYNIYSEAPPHGGYYPHGSAVSTASYDRTSFAGFYEGGDFDENDDDDDEAPTPAHHPGHETPSDAIISPADPPLGARMRSISQNTPQDAPLRASSLSFMRSKTP